MVECNKILKTKSWNKLKCENKIAKVSQKLKWNFFWAENFQFKISWTQAVQLSSKMCQTKPHVGHNKIQWNKTARKQSPESSDCTLINANIFGKNN